MVFFRYVWWYLLVDGMESLVEILIFKEDYGVIRWLCKEIEYFNFEFFYIGKI